jgi:hypothetical protein
MKMKWMAGARLLLALPLIVVPPVALPAAAQTGTQHTAHMVTVAARKKHAGTKNNAPVVSKSQLELAEQMARNSYALGRSLETRRRVALMTRLLYTMRPEVMATEKQQWAEELFTVAQSLPQDGTAANGARNSAIATAAARLAVYDTDRALELLDSLPPEPDGLGEQADARTMAARLVFAGYMQHHGMAGAQTLLAHGRRWSEQGGFPYSASATVLARLRPNEDEAENFFRQVLTIFAKGHEGLYGVSDFASLLQQAAAMEAIYEDTAEEAGRAVVGQLRKFTGDSTELTSEQKKLLTAALNDVRISAPKAYEDARKTAPELFAVRAVQVAAPVEVPKVDLELQTAFRELAAAMRERRGPDEMHAVIARGLKVVNARYRAGECAECAAPDAQSWALVSLAAFATPMTISTQLNGLEDPFWHAYFLAIAAQQVGQPTRVADPTARKVPGKEEAEPE